MALSFYERTLPTPRVVSSSGATWLSLGFPVASVAQIPAEYLDGGGVAYLVQLAIQRTSTNATIRLNLDTNQSGSGGAVGPDFINLFETRGLFRLTAGSVSRVFNLADATTGDTEEPYVWSWLSTEAANEMRAVVDALRVDDPPFMELELFVPDGTLIIRAELGNPQGVRQRVGEAEGLSVGASVGRPRATIHGKAEGITVGATTGRPRGYKPSVAANGFTVEASQRQVTGFNRHFAYVEFSHVVAFGVRDRTRSGGAVWEWNNRDIMPPFPVGDNTAITVLRLRSDQFRVTGSENTLAGLGADFVRHGDLVLSSPGAGEFHITPDVGRFDSAGRIRLTGDEWDTWWTTFSADATNELTVEWFFHGLEPVVSVGRPLGVKDPTRYGLPLPSTTELSVGQPAAVVIGEAEAIASEQSVGRPRGFITKVATQPIALELSTSRPHAFAHAEFVQTDMVVGRPNAQVKRAVNPIAYEQAVGRPAANLFGIPGSSVQGEETSETHLIGRYTLIRPDANSTWQFNTNLDLPVPIMTATASTIAQVHVRANQVRFITSTGQNPGFSQEFITTGRLTLERVGSSSFTITAPAFDHLGRYDPSGLDGYAEWWESFRIGGTLSQLRITFEVETSGFQPFIRFELSPGMPEGRTQVVAEPLPLALENALGRPHAFAHAEFILLENLVGRPGVSTSRAAQPIAQELDEGRPHAYAHAEFIQTDMVVGRPNVSTTKATRPIALDQSVSRPHAFSHVRSIQTEMAIGRPGASTTRATHPIALEQSVGRPHAYAHAEFIQTDMAVGRPGVSTTRAARPIVQSLSVDTPDGVKKRFAVAMPIAMLQSVNRARGFIPKVAAGPIAIEFSVQRPRAIVTRAALPIAMEMDVGEVQPYAHGAGITCEQDVGRPRGYIERVAAHPIVLEQSTSRPHAFAHAEFILLVHDVGEPGVSTTRGAEPIAHELAVGKPQNLREVDAIAFEMRLGRPRGYIPKVAAHPIALEFSVRRPSGVTQARTMPAVLEHPVGEPIARVKRGLQPITLDLDTGKPHSFNHGVAIALENAAGRPVSLIERRARPITLEMVSSMPEGARKRIARGIGITLGNRTGRPRAFVTRAPRRIALGMALGRPASILFTSGRSLTLDAITGRPRGYSESVAGLPIYTRMAVGLPLGERVRTTPAIPGVLEMSVDMPQGYIEAVAREAIMEAITGRPRRYFPRRNPIAQASADIRAGEIRNHATVDPVATTTRASR